LTLAEAADCLDLSLSSADRAWRYARAWLYAAMADEQKTPGGGRYAGESKARRTP
jgi:hypothetical protein